MIMKLLNKFICFVYGHTFKNIYKNIDNIKETKTIKEKIKDICSVCECVKITTITNKNGEIKTNVEYF